MSFTASSLFSAGTNGPARTRVIVPSADLKRSPCPPPPSRSAGDRRAAPPSGRAQAKSSSGGSVPVGGPPRLPAPPRNLVLPVSLLLTHHGLQPRAEPHFLGPPSSGSPLHPAPSAPVGRGAAVRHPEPGELGQHGHQRVHREQLGLLA